MTEYSMAVRASHRIMYIQDLDLPPRLIERRRPKALETKEELLVVLIHIQALDTSPCYIITDIVTIYLHEDLQFG